MIQQRWLVNLILLGFIIVLTVLVIYEPGLDKPVELPKLVDINTSKIQTIRIERTDKETVELSRESVEGWQLKNPLNVPANTFHVNHLLDILTSRNYKPLDVSQLKLADLKLEPPLVRVSFDQLTLAFGDAYPLDTGQRYLRIDQKVYLLTNSVYSLLTEEAIKFASLSPLGNAPKMTELQLPGYHLVAKEGLWALVIAPTEDRDTSTDGINTLVDNWEHAQAISVQHYQEGTPQGQILVTLPGQSEPLSLAIMTLKPEFILARIDKGIQYHLSAIQVDRLLHLPQKTSPVDATATPSTVGTSTEISDDGDDVPVEETTSTEEIPEEIIDEEETE